MSTSRDKVDVMADSIARLYDGDVDGARAVINTEYPFVPRVRKSRSWTRSRVLEIAKRDGFIDRYTGAKLVYPAAMKVMSELMPKEFPYHPHGDMSVGHIAWWELFPTLDHVTPIACGGDDADDNIVLCSMITNGAKSLWTLEQLDLKKRACGDMNEWDGLLKVATVLISQRSELQNDKYIKPWHTAALKLFPTLLDANHEY